jgi:hypothetical protein
VQKFHNGFPWYNPPPPEVNGDWTSPVNFADGTFYYRAEVISQPVEQPGMQMQFCIWQDHNKRETCGSLKRVPGNAGNVVTWQNSIPAMWVKDPNNFPMLWDEERDRYGVAIKNNVGDPVSNFIGWNWHGEDPDEWYPLDMRFTVVVVAEGATFSGWENYTE